MLSISPCPKGPISESFELLVLSAVARLADDAYGVTIRQEIDWRTGRDAPVGVIYSALARLHEKGYVAFRLSDPLPVRGGRARKFVRLTPAGARALQSSTEALARMLDLQLRSST